MITVNPITGRRLKSLAQIFDEESGVFASDPVANTGAPAVTLSASVDLKMKMVDLGLIFDAEAAGASISDEFHVFGISRAMPLRLS